MDLRIVSLCLCRSKGKRTADALRGINASNVARDFGMQSRHAILDSFNHLESLGILKRQRTKAGTKAVYDLRLDEYLSRITQPQVETCVKADRMLCDSGHPVTTAEADKSDRDTTPLGDASVVDDSEAQADSYLSIRFAQQRADLCESGQVGSGIAGRRSAEWARERLNDLGGFYYEGMEPEYLALIGQHSEKAFIDAVYLLDLRLARGLALKKAPEAWILEAMTRGFGLNKADSRIVEQRERGRRIQAALDDRDFPFGEWSIDQVDDDIRDEVAARIASETEVAA
jgi:hypothetical protein